MEYKFGEIEAKWQRYWADKELYKVDIDENKPKFYVLDMFPYPSGAGLHVGHPLGYIASDIYSRYKRLKGFNVLHPMGYDAYGLPAEQYAIQTGQHPSVTTQQNIARYREQMDKIGFSYDWSREVRTCSPDYYKWTQWAFIQMYKHYFDKTSNKAETIEVLIAKFEINGSLAVNAACTKELEFTAQQWIKSNEVEKEKILQNYRLAFRADTLVNWCGELGTVLANDEVKDGLSVRGGHPVEQKLMKQWLLRVSAYAPRLLDDMDGLDWSESLKEIQRNWIGRSKGAQIFFKLKNSKEKLEVFTTRPDTIYGVSFMVIAPEHHSVNDLTTEENKEAVESYLQVTKKRSERERMTDTKSVSGVFTGSYTINPFSLEEIPIYISDYVLAGYGTGAIMAVPAHDSRDWSFARHFDLPIIPVVSGGDIQQASYDAKDGKLINSELINGLEVKEAIDKILLEIEAKGIGKRQINYRLRDAIFSRQRYWGEPFPVYYKDGVSYVIDQSELPLELPEIENFTPTQDGEPPLARAKNWCTSEGYPYELSTMPGFAGSSAYYLRYMDNNNANALVSKEANKYWENVDLYIGGIEHATGHLIYSRYWNKFLFDIGDICKDEPFKKLVNQGMIQGRSNFVYRIKNSNKFVSLGLKDKYETQSIHVDVNIVRNDILDLEAFRGWRTEFNDAEFELEDGKYICGWAVEKMSKSLYNVVNPDSIIENYGADTLRIYEMFLGPLEQSKPWDTNGIDGVHKFLKKYWRLFIDKNGAVHISDQKPTLEEFKILHKTIKKIESDIEHFSFNTSVSAFMICVNSLSELKCNKRAILEPLTILLSSFAPHITEEIWHLMGNNDSILKAAFPEYDASYLVENSFEYPVSFNGKMRFKKEYSLTSDIKDIELDIKLDDRTIKYLEDKIIKKIIVVKGRIINVVI